eukprot:COSAG06_NODE_21766_length_746_cov_0.757342_2_plen_108_part_00
MSYIIYTYKARYCYAPAAEQLLFVSIEERVFAKTGSCERNKKSQHIERLKCNIMRVQGGERHASPAVRAVCCCGVLLLHTTCMSCQFFLKHVVAIKETSPCAHNTTL